ncbi:hypothetical protein [Leptospira santarosai]|nr:hypothetical protein [Leptospira santarosai]
MKSELSQKYPRMTGIRILDKDNVSFEIVFINPNVGKPDPFSKIRTTSKLDSRSTNAKKRE